MAMHSISQLREELAAIQTALAEDALERLPVLVETYHAHLHAWMAAGIHELDEPLSQLRELHYEVITGMQRRQQRLHVRMQAERHSTRAARAYLESVPT